MVRTEQDKQFSVMQMSGNNSSSSLDLIILILLLGRFVLMKEIPGEHFLSHNSGKTLYTASYSESWREIINEYAIFFIASRTFNFFFFSFAAFFHSNIYLVIQVFLLQYQLCKKYVVTI